MTLWNVIRDFFVQYVFGGVDSNLNYYDTNLLGQLTIGEFGVDYYYTSGSYVSIGNAYDGYNDTVGMFYMSMGDWLSTTATIITLVGLFIAITLLIISLFKWIVRLVSLRG